MFFGIVTVPLKLLGTNLSSQMSMELLSPTLFLRLYSNKNLALAKFFQNHGALEKILASRGEELAKYLFLMNLLTNKFGEIMNFHNYFVSKGDKDP